MAKKYKKYKNTDKLSNKSSYNKSVNTIYDNRLPVK